MQINWMVVSCFLVVFLIISGFARGWWKEAITMVALAILVFFLQNPIWAESFINIVNTVAGTIWGFIPDSIITVISDITRPIFGFDVSATAVQFDASASGTWLTILLIIVGAAILLGRSSLVNQPTLLGKLAGAFLGGTNGFLILGLVREYMDGRALPGQQQVDSTAGITVVGSNTYGAAATNLGLQFTNLPSYTILDSAFPWVLMAVGVILLFVVLRTRFIIASDQAGGRKLLPVAPPFYRPGKPPPARVGDLVERLLGLR